MAKIARVGVKVETVATIELNDSELGALDALAGYGVDKFIKAFYEVMGKAYLAPHEQGLRSFLEAVDGCKGMTSAAKECREFLRLVESERRKSLGSS